MNYIYVLRDPRTNEVRYVGKTTNIKTRLKTHVSKARSGDTKHHCANWIRSLLDIGLSPLIDVDEEVSSSASWQDAERRVIAKYIDLGCDLTNSTKGGEGVCGLPEDALLRRAAARKKTMADPEVYERWLHRTKIGKNRPEVKAKASELMISEWKDAEKRSLRISAMSTDGARINRSAASFERFKSSDFRDSFSIKMKEVCGTEDFRSAQSERTRVSWANKDIAERRIASLKSAYQQPDLKARNIKINREINSRPGVRAKKSEASMAMWADDEKRTMLMSAFSAPETKEKQSTARKSAWSEEGKRGEMIAARWTDERRLKQAERLRGPVLATKIAEALSDPDMIKRRNASIKASWARRKAAKLELETAA